MYAGRVEEGAGKRSVKERLNGNSSNSFNPRRQITGKRQRQDDKWEHDLFQEDAPNASNRKIDAQDLRLKLQRISLQNVSQRGRGTPDLCEKLSGPMNADPPTQKVKVAQQARKRVAVETPEPKPERVANTTSRKKAKQNERIQAGKTLQETKKRIAEENEQQRLIALQIAEKEEEKRAREKVLKKLQVDELEQKRALGLPLENQEAKPTLPIVQEEEKSSLPVKSVKKDDRLRECLRSLKLTYMDDNARVKRAFQTLLIYVGNVTKSPDEEKFRKIRLSNLKFQERVGRLKGGIEFLELCGFERSEGNEFLVFPRDKVDMQLFNSAGSLLKSAMANPFFGLLEKLEGLTLR